MMRRYHRMRLHCLCSALLWLSANLLFSCSGHRAAEKTTPYNAWTQHANLRIGYHEEPDNLNPIITNQAASNDVNCLIFSRLLEIDENGKLIPSLATEVPTKQNGGISADGKVIRYHLRHGVRWHDGAFFTADDVIFTWRALMNPSNNVESRVGYDQIASMTATTPYTVVVRLKRVYSPAIAFLFTGGDLGSIVPKHLLAKFPNLNHVGFNSNPVGTGPYKIVHWQHGSGIDLQANDRYYLGPPKIQRIHIRYYGDLNTLLNAFKAHEIDLYDYAPEYQFEQLNNLPGAKVSVTSNWTYSLITINTRRPMLRDVRVRQALDFAINKRAIADKIYHNVDVLAHGDMPPSSWAYDGNAMGRPYDPRLARALLLQAGFTPGHEGILEKRGQPLSLELSTVAGRVEREQATLLIQQDLKAVGVKITIHNYPANILFASYGDRGILANGHFDLSLYEWQIPAPDPDNSQTLGPTQIPPAGQNYSQFSDPRIGALQRHALTTYDISRRRNDYRTIERLMFEEVPAIYLVWKSNIDAYDSDLQNFKPEHVGSPWWNASQWAI